MPDLGYLQPAPARLGALAWHHGHRDEGLLSDLQDDHPNLGGQNPEDDRRFRVLVDR
jgi:hypothetical protein